MERSVEAMGGRKEAAKKEGAVVFKGEEEEEDEELFDGDKKKRAVGGFLRKGSSSTSVSAPCCQVENCAADLTDAKRYHRRHKVCVLHSKAAVVIVDALQQRFCQQCSRFHELSEFDEAKRSCRRRLAGHNERRRKNSSESHAEGSSRRTVVGTQLNENHCRQADQSGRMPISAPGSPTYKHFQIR